MPQHLQLSQRSLKHLRLNLRVLPNSHVTSPFTASHPRDEHAWQPMFQLRRQQKLKETPCWQQKLHLNSVHCPMCALDKQISMRNSQLITSSQFKNELCPVPSRHHCHREAITTALVLRLVEVPTVEARIAPL
ncbi:hypothetical protein DIPPA_02085 [Diplonema papillatum]|nr:hypothetical protein DIPPA_02085 [Diplonema papillatum]